MSRRFKNRHAKVIADPAAEPTPPVVLDDSNSYVNPDQSDSRTPFELNTREVRTAESTVAAEKAAAAAAAESDSE